MIIHYYFFIFYFFLLKCTIHYIKHTNYFQTIFDMIYFENTKFNNDYFIKKKKKTKQSNIIDYSLAIDVRLLCIHFINIESRTPFSFPSMDFLHNNASTPLSSLSCSPLSLKLQALTNHKTCTIAKQSPLSASQFFNGATVATSSHNLTQNGQFYIKDV